MNALVPPKTVDLPFSGTQRTHDLSRNLINVLSSNVIVVLPGGEGTASELSVALLSGIPAIAFALQPELVRHFPACIPRVSTIGNPRILPQAQTPAVELMVESVPYLIRLYL